jgi:cell division protein FtsB
VKLLAVVLASLLALIQYPLWVGQGSWLRVWELDRQAALQQEVNAGKRMRNEGLEAEAADLRGGSLAIEERARYELGMVKQDEIFVQFNAAGPPAPKGAPDATGATEEAGRLSNQRPGPAVAPPFRDPPGLVRPPGGGGSGPGSPGVRAPATVPPDGTAGILTVGR